MFVMCNLKIKLNHDCKNIDLILSIESSTLNKENHAPTNRVKEGVLRLEHRFCTLYERTSQIWESHVLSSKMNENCCIIWSKNTVRREECDENNMAHNHTPNPHSSEANSFSPFSSRQWFAGCDKWRRVIIQTSRNPRDTVRFDTIFVKKNSIPVCRTSNEQ